MSTGDPINPFTGKPDKPTYYDPETGAIVWRDASGNERFVSSSSYVGDFVDPTTGQTVKVVLNKQTGFPSEADDISKGIGAAYNQQHQYDVKTAGDNVVTLPDGTAHVNTGTSPAVVGISGIVNKTLVPAGENLGLLPKGSSQTFQNIRDAADAARAAGQTTADGSGVNVTAGGGGGGGGGGTLDTSALAQAVKDAQALRDQYNVPYTPIASPVAQASLVGPVERAAGGGTITAREVAAANAGSYQAAVGPGAIQAGIATAGMATPAQIASTVLAQRQAEIQAERVAAAQADRTVLGPTALADRTAIAPVTLADQTAIDRGDSDEIRRLQLGSIQGLQGAIDGTDPSVAAIMLRQATDRNAANQFALAASASGQNSGNALRQAQINAAELNQQAIGQQALLRAQEIATARGQMVGALQGTRESDIGLAGQQANLTQQIKLANAGFTNTQNMTQAQLDQAIQLANAGFKNTATTTQAQLDAAQKALNVSQMNAVNTANADRGLAASTTNAQLAQQVELANAGAQNNTSQVNAQLANATGIANAGNQTQASVATANNQTSANNTSASLAAAIAQSNARNQLDLQTTQAKLAQEASLANAANALSADTTNSTLAQALNVYNAGQANAAATTNANNLTGVSQSNAANQVSTNSQNITGQQNTASNTLRAQEIAAQAAAAAASAQSQAISANAAARNANTSAAAQTWQQNVDTAKGIYTIATSDERAKKNTRAADSDTQDLLRALRAVNFEYKNPSAPGSAPGPQFGILAQDLERSAAGKTLVRETPYGKGVDTSRAVLAALAGLSNINRRLEAVENRK